MNRFYLVILFALSTTAVLSAQTITFAQFTQLNSCRTLVLDNNAAAGTATFGTVNTLTGVAVQFLYNDQFSFSGQLSALAGVQDARFTLQSVISSPVSAGASGPFIAQPVESGIIEFRRTTAIGGKDLLLGIHFTGAYLAGFGSSGSLLAAEGAGSQITYTSDFLNFDSAVAKNWSLGLSGISPVAVQDTNGLLRNFTASTAGTFDAIATPIPEPATYGFILGAVALCVAIGWRSFSAKHDIA